MLTSAVAVSYPGHQKHQAALVGPPGGTSAARKIHGDKAHGVMRPSLNNGWVLGVHTTAHPCSEELFLITPVYVNSTAPAHTAPYYSEALCLLWVLEGEMIVTKGNLEQMPLSWDFEILTSLTWQSRLGAERW